MALPGEDGIELASKHGQRTGVKQELASSPNSQRSPVPGPH